MQKWNVIQCYSKLGRKMRLCYNRLVTETYKGQIGYNRHKNQLCNSLLSLLFSTNWICLLPDLYSFTISQYQKVRDSTDWFTHPFKLKKKNEKLTTF